MDGGPNCVRSLTLMDDNEMDGNDEYLYERELGDGYSVYVSHMIFNDRLIYGRTGAPTYERAFCFHQDGSAVVAALSWRGVGDPEGNWIKEVGTERYGPGSMSWEQNTGERLAAKRGLGEREDADEHLDFITGRRTSEERADATNR